MQLDHFSNKEKLTYIISNICPIENFFVWIIQYVMDKSVIHSQTIREVF